MNWPTLEQYREALRNPASCFRHPALSKALPPSSDADDVRIGNSGAVFRLAQQDRSWAVKVFLRDHPERPARYQLLLRTQALRGMDFVAKFEYHHEGIQILGNWYPALIMDWVEGKHLDRYFQDIFSQGGSVDNGRLCQAWVHMLSALQGQGIAHADIQNSNILVQPDGSMSLVDYDSMYVPSMKGMRPLEMGVPSFQHPKRDPSFFDPRLDHFPGMLVLLQLLVVDAETWTRHHKDANHFFLTRRDLVEPEKSAFVQHVQESRGEVERNLLGLIQGASKRHPIETPGMVEVLKQIGLEAPEAAPISEVDIPVRPKPSESGTSKHARLGKPDTSRLQVGRPQPAIRPAPQSPIRPAPQPQETSIPRPYSHPAPPSPNYSKAERDGVPGEGEIDADPYDRKPRRKKGAARSFGNFDSKTIVVGVVVLGMVALLAVLAIIRFGGSRSLYPGDVEQGYVLNGRGPTYTFENPEDQKITIEMFRTDGSMMDPIVMLQDAQGRMLGINDDGAGFPNARLTKFLPAGTYKILTLEFGNNNSGSFSLSVMAGTQWEEDDEEQMPGFPSGSQ